MLELPSIKEVPEQKLRGKRVLLRLDLDVAISLEGFITEDFRLRRGLPTLQYLQAAGAKVIILGHLGSDGEKSLKPVAQWFEKQGAPVGFVPSLELKEIFEMMTEGAAVMLENLRRDPGEQDNDPAFAKKLAALGDYYVNDSFATGHRSHASIVGLPALLPAYAGLNLLEEVAQLSRVFQAAHPFLFILGGAKFGTKVPLIKKFLGSADQIFIGGALANAFFRARGDEIGESLVDSNLAVAEPFLREPKIVLPEDSVWSGKKILDIGPNAVAELKTLIAAAEFILWNGPLGNFEKNFGAATEAVAAAVAASGATTIVGGGDTVAAIEKLGLLDKFTFVSTGGGAMLDFLASGTLPGLEVLKK